MLMQIAKLKRTITTALLIIKTVTMKIIIIILLNNYHQLKSVKSLLFFFSFFKQCQIFVDKGFVQSNMPFFLLFVSLDSFYDYLYKLKVILL